MPMDAPSLAGDRSMDLLKQITNEMSAGSLYRAADNMEQLLSLCSALIAENLQLKRKADGLVVELFKATVMKPDGSTGLHQFARI